MVHLSSRGTDADAERLCHALLRTQDPRFIFGQNTTTHADESAAAVR
jgi:hypothetical protein